MFGFNLRRPRRKSAAQQETRAGIRRLSVEAMEGRLMLAANAADFLSPNYDVTQYGLNAAGLQAVAIETAYYQSFNDGGSLTFFAPVLDGAVAGFPILPRDTKLTGDVIAGSSNVARSNFSMPPSVVFDTDALPTPGIPVLVISPDASDGIPFANSPSPLVSDFGQELSDDEGGQIPIQPIIASIGPGAIAAVGDRAIAKSIVGPQVIARGAAIDTSAVPEFRISGEWARPTMLELAGGEQRAHERESSDRAGQFGDLRDGQRASESPLSSHNSSELSEVNLTSYVFDGGNLRDNVIRTAASKVPSYLRTVYPQDQIAVVDGSRQSILLSTSQPNSPTPGEASTETATGEPLNLDEMHSARTQVFDSLGAEEIDGTALVDRVDTWGTPLKATSLLMILALERIATGNSRRGKPAPEQAAHRRRPLQHRANHKLPPR